MNTNIKITASKQKHTVNNWLASRSSSLALMLESLYLAVVGLCPP